MVDGDDAGGLGVIFGCASSDEDVAAGEGQMNANKAPPSKDGGSKDDAAKDGGSAIPATGDYEMPTGKSPSNRPTRRGSYSRSWS